MAKVPKLILEYKNFFNTEPPKNRIDLIKHIPKKQLLYEIAGLNYRLKPYKSLKIDTSLETQKKELRYFFLIDEKLYEKYVRIASSYSRNTKNYPLIFTRATNLFALEEILNNDDFNEEESFDMKKSEVWDGIFRYLLAVNTEILKVSKEAKENTSLENICASTLSVNELMIEDNPFLTIYKGLKLINYLSNDKTYGKEVRDYFDKTLKIEKGKFLFNLMALSMSKKHDNPDIEFFYFMEQPDSFLNYLSKNKISNNNYITLLTLKKTPFYKENEQKYVLLDINFLINKSYNFFINDFWFDYLKPIKNENGKEKYNYQHYRGVFGDFFEKYVEEVIRSSFSHLKYPPPLLFNDLKVMTKEGHVELADLYIRQNKKILVGQVKSNSIYDKEKYSGEINALYRNDRDRFFEDFGVNQVFQSIKNILKHSEHFDSKLDVNKRLTFFPLIIVNENLFKTPLLSGLLTNRFEELKNEEQLPHKINPLIVMHISDLELLEHTLVSKKKQIWDILKSHYKLKTKTIQSPFAHTADRYLEPGAFTDRVMSPLSTIIKKHSKKDQEYST